MNKWATTLLIPGVALGCRPEEAPAPPEPAPVTDSDPGYHVDPERGTIANDSLDIGLHPAGAPNTMGVLRGEDSFDVSAPATVLVATRWGHGSGVIVDPRGWVLTNAHVVEDGETESFEIHATVTTVSVDDKGRAQAGDTYDAIAHKIDDKRDLALLKITSPGKKKGKFPSLPLAKKSPKPGRKVSAVGNAGAGLGWAVKHCSINAIGTIEDRALAIFNAQRVGADEDERAAFEQAVKEASDAAGLQIQTDCTILPGDSGGPLIDEETHDLVGLNVAINPAQSAVGNLGSVAFHIHRDEIEQFLKDVPTTAPKFLPDPWEMAGSNAALDDTDRDGEVDTLRLAGTCLDGLSCHGAFVDIDQDSFKETKKEIHLPDIFRDRLFDAEFVVFERARMPREVPASHHVMPVADVFFYFDGSNAGALDSLIVIDGETEKHRGYRIADGKVTRASDLDEEKIDNHLFSDPVLHKDFDRLASVLRGDRAGVHDPARTAAVKVAKRDYSGDGIPDTLMVETRLDSRAFVDIDQNSIPRLEEAELVRRLARGEIDAEVVAVAATPYRVYYDTDDDGELDLLLEGQSLMRGVALEALALHGEGTHKSMPEHIGRRLLRPGLLKDPIAAKRLEAILGNLFPADHAGVDDHYSSFPGVKISAMAQARSVPGFKDSVVTVSDFSTIFVFADLDKNTFKRGKERDVQQALSDGTFDAEFVYAYDGSLAWGYYDTNNDGKFDVILVSRGDAPLVVGDHFDLDKEAQIVRSDVSQDGRPMFDPSLFRSGKKRKAFKKMRDAVVDNPPK